MALKPLLSFSSGELDPVLTDNTTLEKFNKGLSTARNVMIGKTGSILSRFSRMHLKVTKITDSAVKLYCPENTDYVLEFGVSYVRVYRFYEYNTFNPFNLEVELTTTITESELETLHFSTSKDYVYIFRENQEVYKLFLDYSSSAFVSSANVFKVQDPIISPVVVTAVGAPTGYKVDYLVTLVINGEESLFKENVTGYNKPLTAATANRVGLSWLKADVDFDSISEIRVYSRPNGGGGYGFLGTTTPVVGGALEDSAVFEDNGSLPDYSNGVQTLITKYGLEGIDVIDLNPKTGLIYQGRLLQTSDQDNEAIIASRPGFQNNFYRDFPYASDSALQFKAGTSGKANVLRMVDLDGLIVFTTNGVYTSFGLLNASNLGLDRKGPWIIDEKLPPLVVPGGLFFVDRANTIRQLIFSQEIQAYESPEQTIFSAHLFRTKTIKTWAFQDGVAPLIIVTFSDGTWATFTYNSEHQMRAWTRHDSKYPVEQVEGTKVNDRSFFITNKNGVRSIEVSLPRRLPVATIVANAEADKSAPTAFMDSIYTYSNLLNDIFDTGENFIIDPVTPADWTGTLNLTTNAGIDYSAYDVGDVFRFFHPITKDSIDLEILSFVDAFEMIVQPSTEFPSEYATSARLYSTTHTVSGLTHLEGEEVSVMADGYVVSSPYNDVEEYVTLTVTAGVLTLPDDLLGAIIHIGRPICADTKTLNINTAEQSPTLLESINVNKLYIRVFQSRGLYCSNRYPEAATNEVDGTSVLKMEALDVALIPEGGVLIGNRPPDPISARLERTIPGSWNSQGEVALRQVDPYHFEILSIIPDITVLNRSDR